MEACVFRFGFKFWFLMALFLFLAKGSWADTKDVTVRASCAIEGMTAEQARYLAVQRARMAAIEQAAGIRVTSSSLVTEGRLAGEFIQSFSKGFITREKVRWLPLTQYQPSPDHWPIAEYGVELTATIFLPDAKQASFGLRGSLNQTRFSAGQSCVLTVSTRKPARIAVFNIMANNRVVMLFPHGQTEICSPGKHKKLTLPAPGSRLELSMATLPGHKRDAEGFFIAALPKRGNGWLDAFEPGREMTVSDFFARYAPLAERTQDTIVSYEVNAIAN